VQLVSEEGSEPIPAHRYHHYDSHAI
jgi:hypothetical protein